MANTFATKFTVIRQAVEIRSIFNKRKILFFRFHVNVYLRGCAKKY